MCYKLFPDATDNPRFLFNFARILRNHGRYRDSNAILRLGTQVSADPVFYILMGNNYKDEQYYCLADDAYKKAYAVMPNRLYPLYQQMLLYKETGESEKCRFMARRIIAMRPKVESPATHDMKNKAKDILTSK